MGWILSNYQKNIGTKPPYPSLASATPAASCTTASSSSSDDFKGSNAREEPSSPRASAARHQTGILILEGLDERVNRSVIIKLPQSPGSNISHMRLIILERLDQRLGAALFWLRLSVLCLPGPPLIAPPSR